LRLHEANAMNPGFTGAPMAPKQSLLRLAVNDLSVDRDGRITIADPRLAARWEIAAAAKTKKPKPRPNSNCGATCNVTKGCGPINELCGPTTTNIVTNCGCTLGARHD
jgi:hypothetical protein